MNYRTRIVRAGGAVVCLLSAIASQSAEAVTLCEKRSGRVVAAEACKKRDTTITPSEIGLIGVPGPTGATGPTGPGGQTPLRIVDGSGRDVCRVIGAGAEPACVLDHPGLSLPVLLVFESLPIDSGIGVGPSTAYYLEPDCAGQPYVPDGRPLLPPASLIGSAVYYATGGELSRLPQSFEHVSDPCAGTTTSRGTCCQPYAGVSGRIVAPAARVAVADLGLAFPFTGVTP